MKRFIISLLFGFVFSTSLYAKNISNSELEQWNSIGISKSMIYYWEYEGFKYEKAKEWIKNAGYSPSIIKSWGNAGIIGPRILEYKKYGVTTPKEAKVWEGTVMYPFRIPMWKKLGISTPKEIKKWQNVTSMVYIQSWKKAGVNTPEEVKKWKKLGYEGIHTDSILEWKIAGVKTPEEVEKLRNLRITPYYMGELKRANLKISEIVKWQELGVDSIENILVLIKSGFKTPNLYKPYKDMLIEYAIKLKKWEIKPNKLIKSMSYTNMVFRQELYFNDKNTFEKAYALIKGHCNEILKDNRNEFFTDVDMSENKNKCYLFIGKMIQRLDNKPLLGKTTQSGLVSGWRNRYFYAEGFHGSWMKNRNKIGVIKGNGSFSYSSKNGKQVVPKGTIVFFK